MSDGKAKRPAGKFGFMKGLTATEIKEQKASTSPPDAQQSDVPFSSQLDPDLYARLQQFVALKKAQKRYGQRVSLKGVLHEALIEYLNRHE